MAIIATLVMGRNQATSLGGKSAPISSSEDRERFLRLHRNAGGYIIGKNSAAAESYRLAKVPIFILSRSSNPLTLTHPMMQQVFVGENLGEIVRKIAEDLTGDLVVEAGPSLLLALIADNLIEKLYLSITPVEGDGNFVELDSLLDTFEIVQDEMVEGTRLLQCRNKGNTGNG
ncbi:unannotated protein [freshwater metagenome]|uniref:Unannotated protein n=1 Tax=freshwater metagenome TaxID=449393 RepID=A0A6J7EN91_9ZZZZ